MKKLCILSLLIMAISPAFSQANKEEKGRIESSYVAEREVTPDVIYVKVTLKEYFENNNNKKRVGITTLENQLVNTAKKLGIDQKDITIDNVNGYSNYINRRKNVEFLDSKNYRIKLSNLNKYNELIDGVDPKGLINSSIVSYDYSKKEELKNELRKEAAAGAKTKAQTILGALDAKVGKIIQISENSFDENIQVYPRMQMMMTKTSIADVQEEMAPELDFKTMKYKVTINASFEIVE